MYIQQLPLWICISQEEELCTIPYGKLECSLGQGVQWSFSAPPPPPPLPPPPPPPPPLPASSIAGYCTKMQWLARDPWLTPDLNRYGIWKSISLSAYFCPGYGLADVLCGGLQLPGNQAIGMQGILCLSGKHNCCQFLICHMFTHFRWHTCLLDEVDCPGDMNSISS